MSNNTVDLSGYLAIREISGLYEADQNFFSIDGWIFTDIIFFGGRHPIIASGKTAQIIFERAKTLKEESTSRLGPYKKVGVTARGKLVSHLDARCFLDIKHISFFDTDNPMDGEDSFVVNTVKLQGFLRVSDETTTVAVGDLCVSTLDAHIETDQKVFGGQHKVLLGGRLASLVSKTSHHTNKSVFNATIGGSLLSVGEFIYVKAKYLSLNGNPRIDL